MIAIDKRLKAIAGFVTQGGFTVDVGADHGYLSIYLIESGQSQRVLATDVREGPLSSARQNIAAHMLDGKIDTLLTDGLNGVELRDVTDIVIAGMGGDSHFRNSTSEASVGGEKSDSPAHDADRTFAGMVLPKRIRYFKRGSRF